MRHDVVTSWVCVVVVVIASLASAGAAAERPRNLQFTHLSSQDGLSQEHVEDIIQDGRGFLWIATQEGLNRFDGYGIRTYEHISNDPRTLSNDFVLSLLVDAEGDLWVGTAGGVNRYDAQTDSFERNPFAAISRDTPANDYVMVMLQDSDGVYWVGTQGNGLLLVDETRGTTTRFRHDPEDQTSLPDDTILSLLEDRLGNVWIGTLNGGFARYDRITGTFLRYGEAQGGDDTLGHEVRAILEDRAGTLWVGTGSSGVLLFDPKRQTYRQLRHDPESPLSLSNDRVRDIIEDQHGTVWLATDDGLAEWRPGEDGFIRYGHDAADPRSIASDQINALFTDASGLLWVGSWNGVSKWNYLSDTFVYHDVRSAELPGDVVTSVVESSDGVLWVGTYGTGLARLDLASGRARFYRHDPSDPTSLPDDRVMALHVDPLGHLWIGLRSAGLARLSDDAEGFERFAHDPDGPDSLGANAVTSVYSDHDGHLWVGTFGGGLNRTEVDAPGVFRRFQHDALDESSISGNKVLTLFEDADGQLWVGTDADGLNRYVHDEDRFYQYRSLASDAGSVTLDTVTDFIEDRNGALWIGTLGRGLLRWSADQRRLGVAEVQTFGKANGLPTNTIFGLLEGQDGAIWFSSNRGVTRFQPEGGSVRQFDARSGLRDNEFNQGARLRSRSGRMLFGSGSGLLSFFPGEIPVNNRPPDVYVSARSRQEQLAVTWGQSMPEVVVGYLDPYVSFDFVALDFTSPDKNRYRYKLDGFDPDWNEARDYRRATYTNLPSGDYAFLVEATNNDGVGRPAPTMIQLSVQPPPWSTWWAYCLYALLVVAIVGASVGRQRAKLRRADEQRLRLEQQVEERTQEIAARNSELEELNERLADASVTDSLTGLRNRRYVDQFIESEIALFERSRAEESPDDDAGEARDHTRTMFFMMIDLDGFKLINDRYGHHAGDDALIQVTEVLRQCCRASDTLIRWGGDEFMVIGFASGFFGVKILAERIREAVVDHVYELGHGRRARLSASIGVAPYPLLAGSQQPFSSWEIVAGIADQGAYIAKSNGKDAWVSISGAENLSPDNLERLGTELEALIASGQLDVDSSLGSALELPEARLSA